MKRRVVLLTEIIAPYRIPVFNILARDPGIDLHVIFLAETDPDLRQWVVYKDEIRFLTRFYDPGDGALRSVACCLTLD